MAALLILAALLFCLLGVVFLANWVLSRGSAEIGFLLGGTGLVLLGIFFLKVAKDLRKQRPWTFLVARIVFWNSIYLANPEGRKTIGLDEGPYQRNWPPNPPV